MYSLVWGTLAAVIGWPLVAFVARPFREFFDIRREVNRSLVKYGNVMARAKYEKGVRKSLRLSKHEDERLTAAQDEARSLAADMRAFANGEPLANWVVKRFHYDANKIASALIGFSNSLSTYGSSRDRTKTQVEKLLRIKSVE